MIDRTFALALAILLAVDPKPTLAHSFLENIGHEVGNCFTGGCDVVWHAKQAIDKGINATAANIAGPFKDAFIEALHETFDKELNPLITRLDGIGMKYLDKIKDLTAEIDTDVQDIIQKAGDVVASDIKTFRQQVLDVALSGTRQLVADIDARLSKFLIDVRCAFDGAQKGAAEWIRQQVTWFGSPDPCWAENGARWRAPRSDDYVTIFRIHECEIRKAITPSASIRIVLDAYSRLDIWARGMRCVSGAVDGSAGALTFEEVEHEADAGYSLWAFVSNDAFRSSEDVPK